jgi:hypothetical protein
MSTYDGEQRSETATAEAPTHGQVYARWQCRECKVIRGDFIDELDYKRRFCRNNMPSGKPGQCCGDMDEIFRGRV